MSSHCILKKIVLVITLSVISQSALHAQSTTMIEDYIWKKRLVLVFASQENSPLLRQQHYDLHAEESALKERDLLIFQVLPHRVVNQGEIWSAESAHKLRERYQVGKEFCVILIGKDGSEKLRSREIVSARELFSVIDAMPMRQREAREHRKD